MANAGIAAVYAKSALALLFFVAGYRGANMLLMAPLFLSFITAILLYLRGIPEPECAPPLRFQTSATHLSIHQPNDPDSLHKWLWDDIEAIDGHLDNLRITPREAPPVIFVMSDADPSAVSSLLRDLRSQWARIKASDEERGQIDEAKAALAQASQRSIHEQHCRMR